MTQERIGDWQQTHTGKRFYALDPRMEDVDFDDICWALSHIVRYGGHAPVPYTVGQHSVLVARLAASRAPKELAPLAGLYGLLHDAAEAYMGDMIRPLKRAMPVYAEAESTLLRIILSRFSLPVWPENPESPVGEAWGLVRTADEDMLATEAARFFPEVERPAEWKLRGQVVAPEPEGLKLPWWPASIREALKADFDRYWDAWHVVSSVAGLRVAP